MKNTLLESWIRKSRKGESIRLRNKNVIVKIKKVDNGYGIFVRMHNGMKILDDAATSQTEMKRKVFKFLEL